MINVVHKVKQVKQLYEINLYNLDNFRIIINRMNIWMVQTR